MSFRKCPNCSEKQKFFQRKIPWACKGCTEELTYPNWLYAMIGFLPLLIGLQQKSIATLLFKNYEYAKCLSFGTITILIILVVSTLIYIAPIRIKNK